MSLLGRTRTELAGAVRSVRYDMGRRPVEPSRGGPDMTSTGMSTFGGQIVVEFTEAEPVRAGRMASARRVARPHRAPRRAAAVTAFGVLTVVGAAGAYLGVVNGLGSLMNETPAAADTFPPPATVTFTPNAGIGGGPVARITAPATATGTAVVAPATTAAAHAPATTRNASPLRTTKPTSRECNPCGGHPPVPTPTAPASAPSATPSTSPSASVSPSPSESSTTPTETPEPSESAQDRRRRWH
jgi:hypothetical protein